MTPKEKAIQIIENINGKPISLKEWTSCSEYARVDLIRKANIVVDEIIKANPYSAVGNSTIKFWQEVKTELELKN